MLSQDEINFFLDNFDEKSGNEVIPASINNKEPSVDNGAIDPERNNRVEMPPSEELELAKFLAPQKKKVAPEALKKNLKNIRERLQVKDLQLTLNEPEKYTALKNYLMGLKNLNYLISTEEVAPKTGHKHVHVYVQFSKKQNVNKNKLLGAHYEICKGSAQDNIDYIRKKNDPAKRGKILDEWGEASMEHRKKITIKELKAMAPEAREELPCYYYNCIEKIKIEENNLLTLEDFSKEVVVYYIWGESGIGKTVLAKKLIAMWLQELKEPGFNGVKFENNFWIGASGNTTICLYDDFRDGHLPPSEFINFVDYNVHTMNIKGGAIKNRYKRIVITSVQDPAELYFQFSLRNPEPKKQWMRRMKIIHLCEERFKAWREMGGVLEELQEQKNLKRAKAALRLLYNIYLEAKVGVPFSELLKEN